MKRYRIPMLFVAFAIMQSCTNFQEEELPISFGVNTNELTFLKGGDTRSLTVSSGSKWDVTSMPGWVSLGKISRSGMSPYEWTVDFSASANDEYNRDGTIVFRAQSETKEIPVTQEGNKGKYIAVESISISPTELSLIEGENASLTHIITPSNASIKDVTWSSSNTSVATVSSTGVVTTKAVGTTTISVTTDDGSKKATCYVTVQAKKVSVTAVSLDKTTLSMTEGDTQTLMATVTPSNATDNTVSWSSSNTSIASVSSSGVVTAKSVGSATITVKTNDGGKTATCSVTVKAATVVVTSVSLNKTSLSMTVGDTQTLTATVTPSNATDKSVSWSSSNTSVATVSSSGVVTAKAAGTATITVTTTDGGKKATCSVTVSSVSVTGVNLDMTSLTMTEGDTQTLTATVSPSNATDKSVTWSSSNTSVATVSSSGVVTAKAVGTATITVTTNDGGKTATCSVTVKARIIAVTGVSLDMTSIYMAAGNTQTLIATVYPSNASDKSVTWSSSDASVATVSSSGVVSAISGGYATITVTTNDGGKTASCSVKVVSYNYDYVDLGLPSGLKWATCNLGASSPEESGDYYAWGETTPKANYFWETYKWYNSSNNTLTKYYSSSPSVLLYSDDAARVNLGGNWRMPTNAEWLELQSYCTWSWTTQNGRSGDLVTGPNGNSIFLPSAGLGGATMTPYVGGYYWSSSLYTSSPEKAWCISFYMSNISRGVWERYYGCSIRPVFTN